MRVVIFSLGRCTPLRPKELDGVFAARDRESRIRESGTDL
jgi:hypothetical protein